MIRKIKSTSRYHAVHGWLSSYHLFSFADYYDPSNMNFGVLRVFNDDTIDGESGFPAHGHRDMEIVTIILEGELTHKDTLGNSEVIKKGEVQYMSTGTGVMHSEINTGKVKTHLYQIWISPKSKNLTPAYAQKDFSTILKKNTLTPLVSDTPNDNALHIHGDATIYKGVFEKGAGFQYRIQKGRGLFLYIHKGTFSIGKDTYEEGDQARIENEDEIHIMCLKLGEYIAIDVKL